MLPNGRESGSTARSDLSQRRRRRTALSPAPSRPIARAPIRRIQPAIDGAESPHPHALVGRFAIASADVGWLRG